MSCSCAVDVMMMMERPSQLLVLLVHVQRRVEYFNYRMSLDAGREADLFFKKGNQEISTFVFKVPVTSFICDPDIL